MILSICPNPSIDTISWIDRIIPGKVNRIAKQKEYPGGKGVHVALAIKEIGASSAVMGFWAGASGSWIKSECLNRGISCFGLEVNGMNRRCYTFSSDLAMSDWKNTELLEPGPVISMNEFEKFVEQFKRACKNVEIICCSGSWPIQSPTFAYKELILRAKNEEKKVILDASGVQLESAIKACPYGIHLNIEEAVALCKTHDLNEILNYLSKYVELIALTRGREGLYLKYDNIVIHANVEIEDKFSTVGSGDCLTAGIAYAISRDMSLKDIARWGVACGAANCLREDLGMLYKKDVDNLSGQIKIKEIVL